jgi:hypothetical protein
MPMPGCPLVHTSPDCQGPLGSPAGVGLSTTSFGQFLRRHRIEAARTRSAQARGSHEPVALGASLVTVRSELAVVADVDGDRPAAPSGWEGREGREGNLGTVAAAPRRDPARRAAPSLSSGGSEGLTAGAAGRYAIVT